MQRGITDYEQINKVLSLVNLNTGKKKVKTFSLGMKQRLGIALAILNNPDFVILDEPINGLDPIGISELRDTFKNLASNGVTLLISSHILSELYLLSDKFAFIENGKLIKEITKEELDLECSKCLVIKTYDTKKVAYLLENNLQTKNYKVIDNEEIRVYDYLETPDVISDVLAQNQIKLKGFYEYGISLDVAVVAKNNNLYYLFIAVIVFVIGSDFSNNTIKNTISTNISKRKYYFSKLVTALILGTLLIFLNAFFSHFANIILNGQSFVSPFTDVLLIIIKQLPLLYAMISILLMLNVIIRKAPLYNGITIPLVMTFQLVLTTAIKFLDLPNYIINYEWETALTKLSLSPDLTYLLQTLGFWAVVFAITVIIGYNNFKARDI